MAVRIRMKRFGRKNRPYYRIGAFDAHEERDGSVIENLGTYDPMEKNVEKQVVLKKERIEYWLSVGAKPTESVASVLKKFGIAFKK
ncbi:MAG: 30S ribosomal protein S16 [Planctomycetes bacterium RIFCSPHIGHO2_02_FULL_38_41]|nr:MAG: 30S ribosomal protein S16 [Planctomycetes bacterium RIFCSPHIGHO2_02_FULL_38_41]OHB98599.1 MAG: 30S ribosomal protein S16 [Planctomycetes bacterium RIFCSPLOWO2_12_38_17]OHC01650.1 MAG: 30S ribosomal protein S16 [Planctomycetes bacterium RIFCSPHIGHO2_12_39_6]